MGVKTIISVYDLRIENLLINNNFLLYFQKNMSQKTGRTPKNYMELESMEMIRIEYFV